MNQHVFVVVLATILSISANGQALAQEVFKWTDENGVVHYGDSVPDSVEDYERVSISPSLTAIPAPVQTLPTERDEPAPQTAKPSTPTAAPQPVSAMSLEELDQVCEAAREREIAPLRQAAIEECKASPRSDPAYCERFNATFGDAIYLPSGATRPRMFNDLPECVQAEQERRSRPRR